MKRKLIALCLLPLLAFAQWEMDLDEDWAITPSSIILHLDFIDGFNPANGVFTDLSGNGYHGVPDADYRTIGVDYVVPAKGKRIAAAFNVAALAPIEYTEIVVARVPLISSYTGLAHGFTFGIYNTYGQAVGYGSGWLCHYYNNNMAIDGQVGAGNISDISACRGNRRVFTRSYNNTSLTVWRNLEKYQFTVTTAWDGTFKLWGEHALSGFALGAVQVDDSTDSSFTGVEYSHAELYGKRLSDEQIENRIRKLMAKYGISQ